MPRLPIDYSKSIIYKIVCDDISITDCYVGSTTQFSMRKSKHKQCCKDDTNNQHIYQCIRAMVDGSIGA